MEETEETYWKSLPNLSRETFFESESEFQEFMERIDQKMIDENIPPVGRQIKGISEAAKFLNTQIPWVPVSFAKDGDYTILSLSAHICLWFKNKYEDRLSMGYSNKSVIKLRGDYYVMNIPHTFGEPKLFFNPSSKLVQDDCINVAKCIEGLTEYTTNRITDVEIRELATHLYECMYLSQIIDKKISTKLIKEAKSDFMQSVDNFFRVPGVHGLSKWHSLQFTEKLLKSYIESKGGTYGFTHDLGKLLTKAEECGFNNQDKYDIEKIQCKPEVRYKSGLVSAQESYNAHIESIKLAILILPGISKN